MLYPKNQKTQTLEIFTKCFYYRFFYAWLNFQSILYIDEKNLSVTMAIHQKYHINCYYIILYFLSVVIQD